MKKHISTVFLAVALLLNSHGVYAGLTPIEELGQFLYFDENLSEPFGQSCASCHDPDFGFADPDKGIPVSEGVLFDVFGTLNSPSAAYAMYAPIRYFDAGEGLWIGGQFWNGRATGEVLGDPLADQALGPFLNPVEMHNSDEAAVIADVAASSYAGLFEQVWGTGSLDDVESAFDQVALSIAAFERSWQFGQFNSKYDFYLMTCIEAGGNPQECASGQGPVAASVGKKIFSKKEWDGLQLFMGENDNDGVLQPGEGAMCAACHIADLTSVADYPLPVQKPDWMPGDLIPPLFTDFTYDNLGVPHSEHPLLGMIPADMGLGPVVGDPAENGKFRVMTLRNIHQTAPYAHNGVFMKLEEITHFYNTRDMATEIWPEPEYAATVNREELGNLGLSGDDEEALVKFMKTLTDGWEGWMQ